MNEIIKIISNEFRAIGTNIPILIVLILGNVGYGFLYNVLYNTNVYKEAPIVIVDMSQSDLSRHFIDYIDATQQVKVVSKTMNFDEAKRMLIEREIVGFLYIPSELKEEIMKGNQAQCVVYGSTLSFLDYLNIYEAVNFASLDINSELLPEMVESLNMIDVLFLANDKAVNIVNEPLYNSSEGYGTYLIPPVMVIIIFQTLMITVAMRCGEEYEKSQSLRVTKSQRHRDTEIKKFHSLLNKRQLTIVLYLVLVIHFNFLK